MKKVFKLEDSFTLVPRELPPQEAFLCMFVPNGFKPIVNPLSQRNYFRCSVRSPGALRQLVRQGTPRSRVF